MKKYLYVLCLLMAASALFAQAPVEKNQMELNAGVGLSAWGLPVYVGLDYGIHKDITVGGELSFRSYHERFLGVGYRHSIIGVLANGNYHFNTLLNLPENLNLYAGANIGFYIFMSPKLYTGQSSSGLGLGTQAGARYFFNDRFGLNLEFGGGLGVNYGGKFGITYILAPKIGGKKE